MNFSYDRFLKPLTDTDKNIKIYDNNNVVKYIINPNNVRSLNVQNNLVYIGLESNKNIILDFSTRNEADLSTKKLQQYIDTLKNTNVPYWIHLAVEQEAIKFTKGPTGSIGPTGSQGIQGDQGNQGFDAYQVWAQTNVGSQQDYLNSLIGPIGPTGPVSLGDSQELLVREQTIYATVDGKDIQIVTKGDGDLLFRIDRDGWLQNFGRTGNVSGDVWASSCVTDELGYIYTTGGDLAGANGVFVTKTDPVNGDVIWQKSLELPCWGESIVYNNNHLYVLISDWSDPSAAGNLSVAKMTTGVGGDPLQPGYLLDYWRFDLNSVDPNKDSGAPYNLPRGVQISVDEDDNIYFCGYQDNFGNGSDMVLGKMNTSTETIDWEVFVDGGVHYVSRSTSTLVITNAGVQTMTVHTGLDYVGGDVCVIEALSSFMYVQVISYDSSTGEMTFDILFANIDSPFVDGDTWSEWYINHPDYVGLADQIYGSAYANGYIYVVGQLYNRGNSPDVRSDVFVAKYDKFGSKVWSKVIGSGSTLQTGYSIAVDEDGNIYICGFLNFNPLPGQPAVGSYNNFYMKLSFNGNIVWSKSINGFNRGLFSIEYNGDQHLYIVSTQTSSSTPPRQSTDLILFKVSKVTGEIEWQQYVGTQYRDAIWGNTLPLPSNGHKSIAIDPSGKSVYIAGLTREGGSTYHNSFLMSFDQSSLPDGTYSNWNLQTASFSVVTSSFDYIESTSNINNINEYTQLLDSTTTTFSNVLGYTFSVLGYVYKPVTLFSPNTRLFVKGVVNIDNNYILPRSSGEPGQLLTYNEGSNLLQWKDQILKLSFNDYSTITNQMIGSSSMTLLTATVSATASVFYGPVDGNFDEARVQVNLPFDIVFMGETYSTIFMYSNSYITFGEPKTTNDFSATSPKVPGIFIEAGDRSMQRIYYKSTVEQYTLRFEGSIDYTGPTIAYPEIEWEITFNKDSGKIDVHMGENLAFGTGFSCVKKTSTIVRSVSTEPYTSFRIHKGFGVNDVLANRIYYQNISGLDYNVYEDPDYPDQSLVSLDFTGLATSAATSFTSFGTTGSSVEINSASSFTIHTGVEYNNSQFVHTEQYFSGSQGLFMQFKIPVMLEDTDRLRLGLQDSNGDWSASIELTYAPPAGNMIVYNVSGGVVTYGQSYNDNDIFSMYVDTDTVFFQINGVTVQTCPFVNTSISYRFKAETNVQALSQTISSNTYSSGELGLVVPDGASSPVSATVSVPLITSPTNIYVEVNMAHTWISDVSVNLQAPSGEIVTLFYGTNGTQDNFTNTVFTSNVSYPSITTVGTPHTGTFEWAGDIGVGDSPYISTVNDLTSLLAGQPTTGDWILALEDYESGDEGTLQNFSIFFEYTVYVGVLSTDYTFEEFRFYPTGAIGTSGVSGSSGSSGTSGSSGSAGSAGSSGTSGTGFIWRGDWNPAGSYISDVDVVSDAGGTYIKIGGSGNSGSSPSNDPVRWGLVAQPGSAGSSGASGSSGSSGTSGSAGSSGTSGTGFSAITNYSNNRILTSDGGVDTANAEANLTFDGGSLTVTGTSSLTGHTILQQTSELVTTSFGATASTVSYNFASGSVWYHGTANTNYTADFINMPTTNDRAVTATIILSQGVTAYSPTVVKIDGTTQTVKWANGTYSVTSNGVDIVGFTFLRSGSAWTQVLGQISTFS